ncbi:MAG: SOS response-associated peptidase family protein [Mycobacteriales bacterium]
MGEGPPGAARLINARRETVTRTPAFRTAYARRRCLLPADGYDEWQVDGTRKQPWFLSSPDGGSLARPGGRGPRSSAARPGRFRCARRLAVGPAVGNVRNDGPELVQPVAPEQPPMLF